MAAITPQRGAVRRLFDPPGEPQSAGLEELEQFRNRVGAVLRMQQRIGERRPLTKVRRVAQQLRQRVAKRQRLERARRLRNPSSVASNPDPPAELLQHVDAVRPYFAYTMRCITPFGFSTPASDRSPASGSGR
jgi:hypothetical protein